MPLWVYNKIDVYLGASSQCLTDGGEANYSNKRQMFS